MNSIIALATVAIMATGCLPIAAVGAGAAGYAAYTYDQEKKEQEKEDLLTCQRYHHTQVFYNPDGSADCKTIFHNKLYIMRIRDPKP